MHALGFHAIRGRRTRSRRASRASHGARSPGACRAAGRARHLADRGSCTRTTDQAFATGLLPLVLPDPAVRSCPRRLIGADPSYYLRASSAAGARGLQHFDPRALAEYERCFARSGDRSTRPARTTARRRRSISSTTPPIVRRPQVRLPHARALGRKGSRQSPVQPYRDWQQVADDVCRPRAAVRTFPGGGGAGRDIRCDAWRFLTCSSAIKLMPDRSRSGKMRGLAK